jgi:hypothetical protein
LKGRNRSCRTAAMVDSGATALFIGEAFTRRHKMFLEPLVKPIKLLNIDRTLNKAGSIHYKMRLILRTGTKEKKFEFLVTDCSLETIVLGLPWLRIMNPDIDWAKGELHIWDEKGVDPPSDSWQPEIFRIATNHMDRRILLAERILGHTIDEVWCAAGFTYSQAIAEQQAKAKGKRTFEEMVPSHYCDYARVFSDEAASRLPQHQPWDHAIDLVPEAKAAWKAKIYPMSPNEQAELDKFLDEQLEKGYIEPSKLPLASPVFFIKKKDGKLRLIQDYQCLNTITIPN